MSLLFILLSIVGCVLARPSSENATQVEVTLYYETLCPASRDFITTELYQIYKDIFYNYCSLISKLTLVPYGWVKVINATRHKYQCQHGKAECDGNRLHGCAVKYIDDDYDTVDYISCLASQRLIKRGRSLKYPIGRCRSKLTTATNTKITNCYESDEGWELFAKNGNKTKSFFPSGGFVPYISFNNKKDNHLALAAFKDFKFTLCNITGVVDDACYS